MNFGKNFRILAVMCCLLVLVLVLTWPYRCTVIGSNSVKYRFAFWEEEPEFIEAGDYILFTWEGADPQGKGLKDGMTLVKKVGCLPGQALWMNATEGWCDDQFLATVKNTDFQGDSLRPFLFKGLVPAQSFFVIGDSEWSYDSRYWGFVAQKRVLGKIIWGIGF